MQSKCNSIVQVRTGLTIVGYVTCPGGVSAQEGRARVRAEVASMFATRHHPLLHVGDTDWWTFRDLMRRLIPDGYSSVAEDAIDDVDLAEWYREKGDGA